MIFKFYLNMTISMIKTLLGVFNALTSLNLL